MEYKYTLIQALARTILFALVMVTSITAIITHYGVVEFRSDNYESDMIATVQYAEEYYQTSHN